MNVPFKSILWNVLKLACIVISIMSVFTGDYTRATYLLVNYIILDMSENK